MSFVSLKSAAQQEENAVVELKASIENLQQVNFFPSNWGDPLFVVEGRAYHPRTCKWLIGPW